MTGLRGLPNFILYPNYNYVFSSYLLFEKMAAFVLRRFLLIIDLIKREVAHHVFM